MQLDWLGTEHAAVARSPRIVFPPEGLEAEKKQLGNLHETPKKAMARRPNMHDSAPLARYVRRNGATGFVKTKFAREQYEAPSVEVAIAMMGPEFEASSAPTLAAAHAVPAGDSIDETL